MTKERPCFPLEKILTISVRDYVENVGKKLKDYELRGVHSYSSNMPSVSRDFAEETPLEAEVVVEYRFTSATSGDSGKMDAMTHATGTALIPKKSPDQMFHKFD